MSTETVRLDRRTYDAASGEVSRMNPRYPVFVPSKGRWQKNRALTAQALIRDDVPFRLVVEPQERDEYVRLVGEERVLVLPFRDRGTSTPARNWLYDYAIAEGYDRHWCLDDNLIEFRRLWYGRRIPCHAGLALRVCEDLSDRFDNVAVSGLNYQMFVPAETPVPFYLNCHIYSCILISHAAPVRWRLRYNEDTDLCLQALTEGWCTIALNAFMANKLRTMAMGGGNTESLYQVGEQASASDTEGRYAMAELLREHWPGLVTVRRRFGRFQHVVNWGRFKQPLRLRDDVDLAAFPSIDEYGVALRKVREVQSPTLRALLLESRTGRGSSTEEGMSSPRRAAPSSGTLTDSVPSVGGNVPKCT